MADRITQGAAEDLLLLQSAITAYRDSLHDEFAALTDMLQMAQAAIVTTPPRPTPVRHTIPLAPTA